MRRLHALVLCAVLVTGLGVAVAFASTRPSELDVVQKRWTPFGTILVDREGVTLYLFAKDRDGRSACGSACRRTWPPFVADGRHVTYRGHPLYRFEGDAGKAGVTNGEDLEAFGGRWYAVGPDGRRVAPRVDR